jgi:hypothetical protein
VVEAGRVFSRVSDHSLVALALCTNSAGGPARQWAPRFVDHLGDLVAAEIGHRKGLSVNWPAFPDDLSLEESEGAVLVCMAIARNEMLSEDPAPDEELVRALHRMAQSLTGWHVLMSSGDGRTH